jgi:hypothetical protein
MANDYYQLYGEFNEPRCLNLTNQLLYCRGFDSWLQAASLINSTSGLEDFSSINLKSNNPLLLKSDLIKTVVKQTAHLSNFLIYRLKGIDLVGWLD